MNQESSEGNAAAENARVEAAKQAYIAELRRHPGGKKLRPGSSWNTVNNTTYAVLDYWKQRLGRPVDFLELPQLREEHFPHQK